MSIRLVVADQQEIVLAGLTTMLQGTDIEMIGATKSGREAVDLTMEHEPDLTILEITLADIDGIQAMGQIKLERPDLYALIYSTHNNPWYVAKAVALGAEGYLLKSSSPGRLVNTIRTAAAGEPTWTRTELRRAGAAMAMPMGVITQEVSLTDCETKVLECVVRGDTNRTIGEKLCISYETVKEHVQNVLSKIGVSDRTQAAVWAVRKGLA